MKVEYLIKKQKIFSLLFIVIGVTALILYLLTDIQDSVMLGITSGFLPTGIGLLIAYKKAENNKEMQKKIVIENEERNIFINTKAGNSSFWISFWIVFVGTIFGPIIGLSLIQFGSILLILMGIIYFSNVVINHNKY